MTIKVRSENLILINNLTKTSDRLATAMGRLSTGYRINSASDGAAELMLSKGLEKQISGLSVCNDNANMAKSLLTVADGSLSEITSMAQRIRDIALSSANGIYSEDERRAYQSEVDALVEEIKRQTDEAKYNDYKLFYGNTSPAIKTNVSAGTSGTVGTYKVQKVSKEEAEAQGYTCVSTAQELKDALVAGDANCKVMLMNDINLDDLALDATGSNWTAVGNYTTRFEGTLDGNGYTIRNLKINATSSYQGLFGCTKTGSTIKNLNIENVDVKNTGNYTGVLVGINIGTIENCSVVNLNVKSEGNYNYTGGFVGYNAGTINNCQASGNVTGQDNTGGFIGGNYGTITLCSTSAKVIGHTYTGGFVGGSYDASVISQSSSTGSVEGAGCSGGFIGVTSGDSKIASSYATGAVVSSGNLTGGFVGFARDAGFITSSYATGSVIGGGDGTGGFVGRAQNTSSITLSYATGNISGNNYTGGFVGSNNNTSEILESYSTGNVTGNGNYTGGFAGHTGNGGSLINSCYSTGNTIGTAKTGGFTGGFLGSGTISNSYCTGTAMGNTSSTGDFLGDVNGSATLDNYAFIGSSGNGIGSGTSVGADDTAGKDANWFESRNNLASILGDSFDYSYLNSNLTFQVGVNAGSLNTLDINLSFGVDNLRIDVMSGDSSRESISAIDELIEYTTQVQGRIGSSMNALDSVLGNNTQTQINLTESNSRLIDADIARESAEVVKTQIRQNMTASLLAQTGTNMSQIVLALYGLGR